MAPTPRIKSVLAPVTLQRELQRTIAVSCMDAISAKHPDMSVKALEKLLFNLYHGNPQVNDSVGYINHLLAGRFQLETMWNKEEIQKQQCDGS